MAKHHMSQSHHEVTPLALGLGLAAAAGVYSVVCIVLLHFQQASCICATFLRLKSLPLLLLLLSGYLFLDAASRVPYTAVNLTKSSGRCSRSEANSYAISITRYKPKQEQMFRVNQS
jgi:hypothetical protein